MSDTTSRKTDKEILDTLHDLISEYGLISVGNIPANDQNLVEYGFDDLDEVEFCMAVEEAFNIPIPDAEFEKLKTLNDYLAYLRNHGV